MRILGTLLVVFLLVGCNSNQSVTTQSGVAINYISNGTDSLVSENIFKFNASIVSEKGQEVWVSGAESAMMQYRKSSNGEGGLFQEVLDYLKIGDSVAFDIPTTDFFNNAWQQQVPDSLNAEGTLTFNLGLVEQMTVNEYQEMARQLEIETSKEEYAKEEEVLLNYLSENNIDPVTTESGLRYVMTKEGTGAQAEALDMVNVKYKGMLLDGSVFDSGEYNFRLGTGGVIKGWDEGIAYLNVGGAATLYIPSSLGYGSRGSRGAIPPFASLIFEVELLSADKQSK
ncbi:MAG: FKBP-type peptidyl-prolyl cis-trans isomerase [Cyclobacteriaceae bacterium]